MKFTLVLALFFTIISSVYLHNDKPAKPQHQVIEVIEVEEVVKPAPKPEKHHVKPVAVVPVQQVVTFEAIKEAVHRYWPLFCLVPKAYHLKPELKLKCPKLLAATTHQLIEKIAAQGQLVAHPQPVLVEKVKIKA